MARVERTSGMEREREGDDHDERRADEELPLLHDAFLGFVASAWPRRMRERARSGSWLEGAARDAPT
jgi:hypothetical protein